MRFCGLVLVGVVACAASEDGSDLEPPEAPGKADHSFTVTGQKAWYLVGNGLTQGDARVSLAIAGPSQTGFVGVWLDRKFAGRARKLSTGRFDIALDLATVAIGEHQILL